VVIRDPRKPDAPAASSEPVRPVGAETPEEGASKKWKDWFTCRPSSVTFSTQKFPASMKIKTGMALDCRPSNAATSLKTWLGLSGPQTSVPIGTRWNTWPTGHKFIGRWRRPSKAIGLKINGFTPLVTRIAYARPSHRPARAISPGPGARCLCIPASRQPKCREKSSTRQALAGSTKEFCRQALATLRASLTTIHRLDFRAVDFFFANTALTGLAENKPK